MLHTLKTLSKFKNEKQLFYCEPQKRLLNKDEFEEEFGLGNTPIYPVLRSELEVTTDINFKAAHGDALVAKSLWGICAGAFHSESSPTGYQSFDGLACVTPALVEKELKSYRENLQKALIKCIPQLFSVYEATRQHLSTLSEKQFNNDTVLSMVSTCMSFEKAMKEAEEKNSDK